MNRGDRQTEPLDRRQLLLGGTRVVATLGAGGLAGYLLGTSHASGGDRWQIDPDACIGCGLCATRCVLEQSAVKAVQCFDMCGYCDVCTGYFDPNYIQLNAAAENQLCPTGAITRTLIERKAGQKFYEYTIDEPLCVGCGKCVKGCALMNGSLYLQVMHDRCVNCNECAIGASCPTQAFRRVPESRPYMLKRAARDLLEQKAQGASDQDTPRQRLLDQVTEP